MVWTKKYWEMIDQLYWSPKYLGLASINKKHWEIEGDRVSIPKSMTNPTGPIYRRTMRGSEYQAFVRRQEEIFNNMFDLVFGVVASPVIASILGEMAGLREPAMFESLGRNLFSRYGWQEVDNITQPDGLFVSESSTLAVELKFNAKASPNQFAKYCALFLMEERCRAQKLDARLLYILNQDPQTALPKQLLFSPESCHEGLAEMLIDSLKEGMVRDFLTAEMLAFRDLLNRMVVTGVTWSDFAEKIEAYTQGLNDGVAEKTLANLLNGLAFEIREHALSGAAPI